MSTPRPNALDRIQKLDRAERLRLEAAKTGLFGPGDDGLYEHPAHAAPPEGWIRPHGNQLTVGRILFIH